MFREFLQHLAQSSPVAVVVAVLAAMLFGGFLATRVTKLARLPNVTAYILAGVALGPYALNLVPKGFL